MRNTILQCGRAPDVLLTLFGCSLLLYLGCVVPTVVPEAPCLCDCKVCALEAASSVILPIQSKLKFHTCIVFNLSHSTPPLVALADLSEGKLLLDVRKSPKV